jgi:hypothetical protein
VSERVLLVAAGEELGTRPMRGVLVTSAGVFLNLQNLQWWVLVLGDEVLLVRGWYSDML